MFDRDRDIRIGRDILQRSGIYVEVGIFTGVGVYSQRPGILTEVGDIHSKPDSNSAFRVWN
jgi:hypothetical protein